MTDCEHADTTTVTVCSPSGPREMTTCNDCNEIVHGADYQQTFGQRTADCDECSVEEQNADVIMKDVIVGERNPGNWWCPTHVAEFEEETRKWAAEGDDDE